MRSLEAAIDIHARPEAVFDLIHDYPRRLEWDIFLKDARLLNDSCELILCLGCMQLIVNVQDRSGRPLYWALENLHGDPMATLAEEALGKREVRRLVEAVRKPPAR